MKKIIVASENPVKINATQKGFIRMFPQDNFDIRSIKVDSEVSNQPQNDEETLKGAENRAKNAKKAEKNADFWVGIEGGIDKLGSQIYAFAWIVILSENKIAKARTATFFLPEKIIELLNKGIELGKADDIIFKNSNSKQKNGAVGILTHNVIDRTEYYSQAVILSLIPFVNKELY